jgi:hypothetical protein
VDSNSFLQQRQALNDQLSDSRVRIAVRAKGLSAVRVALPFVRIACGELVQGFMQRGGAKLTFYAALPWLVRAVSGRFVNASKKQSVFMRMAGLLLQFLRVK